MLVDHAFDEGLQILLQVLEFLEHTATLLGVLVVHILDVLIDYEESMQLLMIPLGQDVAEELQLVLRDQSF